MLRISKSAQGRRKGGAWKKKMAVKAQVTNIDHPQHGPSSKSAFSYAIHLQLIAA
jgi:hypothetical protein